MRLALTTLTLTLIITGCSGTSSATGDAQAHPLPTAPAQASADGASYTKLRQRLVLDGWLPLQHADCAADTGRPQACNR